MIGTVAFLVGECVLNLRRQGLMAFACIGTAGAALLVVGLFLLAGGQIYQVVDGLPRRVEVHAFLKPDVPRERAEALHEDLGRQPGVSLVRLVTREESWTEFRRKSAHKDVLEGFTENPFPDMIRIVTKTPMDTLRLADQVRRLPEVDTVRDGRDVVRQLVTLLNVIRTVGLIVALGLGLLTAFIVHNTVRLTLHARRRDIRLMQLVGATPGMVTTPFVLEGVVVGAVGGGWAFAVLLVLVNYYKHVIHPGLPVINQYALVFHVPLWIALLVGGGALLGMLGSAWSLRWFTHAHQGATR